MKPIAEVVGKHRQKYEGSCVAWSLELLLKAHDQIGIDEYPFQGGPKPCGFGYGEDEIAELRLRGVHAVKSQNATDFPAFELLASENLKKGVCTVFMMPSSFYLNKGRWGIDVSCHAFTVAEENGQLMYLTWNQESNVADRIPSSKMADVHDFWLRLSKCAPSAAVSLLNTLSGHLLK